MRVLMLGNSFTFFNDLPEILARLTGWTVASNTRGGAYLEEQTDEASPLGEKGLGLLKNEKWDYVVLQEQSNCPATDRERFLAGVRKLVPYIKGAGAVPVFYATWAYREGTEKLASVNMTYGEMLEKLTEGYECAAREADGIIARVGEAFQNVQGPVDLLTPDDFHPSAAGSVLAAAVIRDAILSHENK